MVKNFPYTQPTRRWRVLRCHEFQWYTKTLKVDNYRSLSTVGLHRADPVHANGGLGARKNMPLGIRLQTYLRRIHLGNISKRVKKNLKAYNTAQAQ